MLTAAPPARTLAILAACLVAFLLAALPAAAQTDDPAQPAPAAATGEPEASADQGEADPQQAPAGSEEGGTGDDAEGSGSTDEAEGGEVRSRTASRRSRREFGSRALYVGKSGYDVRVLQRLLGKLNFPVQVTGRFDARTKQQMRRYELWKEDRVNGRLGKGEARRMRERVGAGARYRTHVFPVRGPHNYGSSGSRFGAPRSGRTHQGQDVAAAEGTRMVAVHEGHVSTRQYQAGGAGHYLVIRGKDGSNSVYMHMKGRPIVAPGEKVMAGQQIGRVGNTGGSTGPHLHFELWTPHWYAGGSAYDPLPDLLKWDRRT